MSIKKIVIIICFIIVLAIAILFVIEDYRSSGNYYCNFKLKKKSNIDISNSVRLYSLTYDNNDDVVLQYNTHSEIVKVESIYPIIKIAKFNGDKIIIDFNTNSIYTINSGIVETYSANIYKDKHNSVYIEAIDEKKNISNTVFGNKANLLTIDTNEFICDHYFLF